MQESDGDISQKVTPIQSQPDCFAEVTTDVRSRGAESTWLLERLAWAWLAWSWQHAFVHLSSFPAGTTGRPTCCCYFCCCAQVLLSISSSGLEPFSTRPSLDPTQQSAIFSVFAQLTRAVDVTPSCVAPPTLPCTCLSGYDGYRSIVQDRDLAVISSHLISSRVDRLTWGQCYCFEHSPTFRRYPQ